jgi:hypothetical protein
MAERQREATGQHNNQPNKRGMIEQQGGTTRGTGITMQRHATIIERRARQEVEPPAERQREATRPHNNQSNKRGMMEQQKLDAPAEGFGKAERAADKRSGQQEWQQRIFVAGCVIV